VKKTQNRPIRFYGINLDGHDIKIQVDLSKISMINPINKINVLNN
jgi:hypothetical protein